MALTTKLKEIRKRLKLSQVEMSGKLEITQSYYSALERGGKEMPATIIQKLIDNLDVSPNWYYSSVGDIFNSSKHDITADGANSSYADELVRTIESNPNFDISNNLYFKVVTENSSELAHMTATLKSYFSNVRKLIQFVDQYDYLIKSPSPQLAIMDKLDNLGRTGSEDELKTVVKFLPQMLKIIDKLNSATIAAIKDLTPLDYNKQLHEDYRNDARNLRIEAYTLIANNKKKDGNLLLEKALEKEKIYDKIKELYYNID